MNYFGGLKDKRDKRDFRLKDFLVGDITLPDQYTVPYIPPVKNQGQKPTCVSVACSTIKEMQEKAERGEYIEMSGDFIYWLAMQDGKADQYTGMYFRDAAQYLATEGMIENRLMPYSKLWRETEPAPLAEWRENAAKYKIKSYARVEPNMEAIKQAIYTTGPVLIGLFATNFTPIDNYLPMVEKVGNGHAVVGIGWNKDNDIEILNSWGPWSEDGRAYVQHEDTKRIFDVWSFVDETMEHIDPEKLTAEQLWRKEVQEAKEWSALCDPVIMNKCNTYEDERLLVVQYRTFQNAIKFFNK